jgi:Protein of unknown function (DUF4239)
MVRRSLRTLWSLTPTVAGVTALSIAGMFAARHWLDPEVLRAAGDTVGNYLQTVGGVYAVLLAFVVSTVWGHFNDARGYVAREAAAIVDVYRTASALSHDRSAAALDALRHYLDAVIKDEWQAMAEDDDAVMEKTGHLLDDAWVALVGCAPEDSDGELFGEVISRFNDLTELRAQRLTAAHEDPDGIADLDVQRRGCHDRIDVFARGRKCGDSCGNHRCNGGVHRAYFVFDA